jgi:hypothetical protein
MTRFMRISSNPFQNTPARNGTDSLMKTRWKVQRERNDGENSWWDMRRRLVTKFPIPFAKIQVDSYNFGSILRVSPKVEYEEKTTIFGKLYNVYQLIHSPQDAIPGCWTGQESTKVKRLDTRGAWEDISKQEMITEIKGTATNLSIYFVCICISICRRFGIEIWDRWLRNMCELSLEFNGLFDPSRLVRAKHWETCETTSSVDVIHINETSLKMITKRWSIASSSDSIITVLGKGL